MVRYAFFMGCQIPMRLPSIEIAARKVFEKVGLEAVDLLGYSCCPEPVISRLLDEITALAISARNLTMAEEMGLNMMTLCNGCYETLAEANETLKHDLEKREKINRILKRYGREFKGNIEVKHVIEVLYEDVGLNKIKGNVVKPQRMRVALHYGCHLHREYKGPDIMRKPNMMREIAAQTGVEIVNYGLERLCCGYPSMQADEEFSLKNRLLLKLSRIRGSGADAIVTACPACMIQFEIGQVMLRSYGAQFNMPCINLMELLALSFGIPYQELRLELHRSPVLQLVQRMEAK
ncbi:MAG: heterodisulfide reductase-related iron-sulfur binding cluster [Candidatus Bathyarchaeia archaeon]|nr:CoB--CoM heterodisulfide reductase subunit B [Candidatus Bathyarchaeota archaeon]